MQMTGWIIVQASACWNWHSALWPAAETSPGQAPPSALDNCYTIEINHILKAPLLQEGFT